MEAPAKPVNVVPLALGAEDGQILPGVTPILQITERLATPGTGLLVGWILIKNE